MRDRLVAAVLDAAILACVGVVLGLIVAFVPDSDAADDDSAIVGVLSVLAGIVGWLYYAIMESSRRQATFGKAHMGLFVTDLKGERISFWRATGRYLAKWASILTLFVGFFMAGFNARRQTLHDMLAGCLMLSRQTRS